MLSNISRREKNILAGGILFLVVFFGYQAGVAPVFEKKENLTRAVQEKQVLLEELNQMLSSYLAVNGRMDQKARGVLSRSKNFSLFSFVDQQAQQSGVKENVAYMKPMTRKDSSSADYVTAVVKIKLKEVYLKELVDFLYRIESSPNSVSITSLSLTRSGKKKDVMDAVIETQTLVQKAAA